VGVLTFATRWTYFVENFMLIIQYAGRDRRKKILTYYHVFKIIWYSILLFSLQTKLFVLCCVIQGGSTKYHLNSRWLQVFKSDRDRRDLVSDFKPFKSVVWSLHVCHDFQIQSSPLMLEISCFVGVDVYNGILSLFLSKE